MRTYDGLYIFAGAVKDDALEKLVERVGGEITRLAGAIRSVETLGKRTFARPMKKHDFGVYVRIRFDLDPAALRTLIERYHLIEEVFRVQILAVDVRRETALAAQAAKRRAREEAAQAAARAAAAAAPAAAQG